MKNHAFKNITTLAGWYWAMARKPYSLLCALFAIQQLAMLLLLAASKGNLGMGYATLYMGGMQWTAFGFAFLGAGVLSARALMQASGRTKAGYTLLTLPMPRWQLLCAGTLACAVMQLGVVALQLLLFFAACGPVSAVSHALAQTLIQGNLPAANLYVQLVNNDLLVLLLPTRPTAALALLGTLAASAIMLPCMFLHRGWRRLAAAAMALAGAACCCILVVGERYLVINPNTRNARGYCMVAGAIALVLVAAAWLWGLHAVKRAQIV